MRNMQIGQKGQRTQMEKMGQVNLDQKGSKKGQNTRDKRRLKR